MTKPPTKNSSPLDAREVTTYSSSIACSRAKKEQHASQTPSRRARNATPFRLHCYPCSAAWRLETSMKPLPSREHLLHLFDYDPDTGYLWRREATTRNTRWRIGKRAGCLEHPGGHRYVGIKGKLYGEHRVIWKMVYGSVPPILDHINGIRDDNRLTNLRCATSAQNHQNTRSVSKTAGVKGVYWNKRAGKWHVQTKNGGSTIYLGQYDDLREAALRYDREARKLFGEFACTNRMMGTLPPLPIPEWVYYCV